MREESGIGERSHRDNLVTGDNEVANGGRRAHSARTSKNAPEVTVQGRSPNKGRQ